MFSRYAEAIRSTVMALIATGAIGIVVCLIWLSGDTQDSVLAISAGSTLVGTVGLLLEDLGERRRIRRMMQAPRRYGGLYSVLHQHVEVPESNAEIATDSDENMTVASDLQSVFTRAEWNTVGIRHVRDDDKIEPGIRVIGTARDIVAEVADAMRSAGLDAIPVFKTTQGREDQFHLRVEIGGDPVNLGRQTLRLRLYRRRVARRARRQSRRH